MSSIKKAPQIIREVKEKVEQARLSDGFTQRRNPFMMQTMPAFGSVKIVDAAESTAVDEMS